VLTGDGGADRRQSRSSMGEGVATLDLGGVDVPHPRHRVGIVLGLLRIGLGWLVVLGPGGECELYAVVGCMRARAFSDRYRTARLACDLDDFARHHGLWVGAARHLPGAFGRADFGARLRG